MSAERAIEDALVTSLDAATSYTVRLWADQSSKAAPPAILVKAHQRTRLQPNYDFYSIEVEAVAVSHQGDDDDQTDLDTAYGDARTWLDNLQASDLSPTGVTVNGIVPTGGAELDSPADDSLQYRGCMATIYATITTTTTTTTTTT